MCLDRKTKTDIQYAAWFFQMAAIESYCKASKEYCAAQGPPGIHVGMVL